MISRAFRFHGHASLKQVYSRGLVVRGQFFSLKYQLHPHRKRYRAAVVVSKKVHKSAVVRNRIRRRLYECIRTTVPSNAPALDLVFVVYSEAVATMPAAELREQVLSQLQKAGAIQ